jgi:hypothetical protein
MRSFHVSFLLTAIDRKTCVTTAIGQYPDFASAAAKAASLIGNACFSAGCFGPWPAWFSGTTVLAVTRCGWLGNNWACCSVYEVPPQPRFNPCRCGRRH